MATLRKTINALRNLRESLADTDDFFLQFRDQWLAALRQITLSHALALRPETADLEEWSRFADSLADKIEAFYSANLARFRLAVRDFTEDPDIEIEEIKREQVLDWVKAGFLGDPLGKNILESEFWVKTDAPEKIANGVFHIMKSGNSTVEWNTLRTYLSSRTVTGTDDLLTLIFSEWLALMTVIARNDWRDWVKRRVLESFS